MGYRREDTEGSENAGGGDHGSFWTSYSDLLLGLSVIFLVLFFFTILRTGVDQTKAQVERKETEQLLAGKVPQSVAEKSRLQQEQVKTALEEIHKKKELINQNAAEMQQMVSVLNQQSNVVNDIIRDQQEKAALLANLSEKSEQLKTDLQTATQEKSVATQSLLAREAQLSELSRRFQDIENRAAQMESASAALRSQIDEKERILAAREQSLQEQQSRVADLDRALASEKAQALQLSAGLAAEKDRADRMTRQLDGTSKLLAERDQALIRGANELDQMKGAWASEQSKAGDLGRRLELERAAKDSISKELELSRRGRDELGSEVARIQGVNQELSRQLDGAKRSNSMLTGDLAAATAEAGRLRDSLAQGQLENGRLRGELASSQMQAGNLKNQLGQTSGELTTCRSASENKDRELARLQNQLLGIQDKNSALAGDQAHLKGRLALCEEATNQARNLGSELEKARAQIDQLKKNRREVASAISTSLSAQGVQAQVNPQSGVLTLAMDEAFRFKNGSAELTDSAKEKLRKIMPVYAAKIFDNSQTASKLRGITITGHASPRYNKKYVNPRDHRTAAHRYNLELSRKRAEQILAFIFGAEIGEYPHKYRLKVMSKAFGKGHSQPLSLERGLASSEPCGKFDCAKSRRVELSFVLEGEEQ